MLVLAMLLIFAGVLMLVSTVSAVAPVNSVPAPTNSSIERGLNPTLSITINDDDGNSMNQTFRTSASGTWATIASNHWDGNGTLSNTTTVFTSYSTTYYWSSNLSDGLGGWDNDTYHFTTMQDPSGSGVENGGGASASIYKILTVRVIGDDAVVYAGGKSMPVNEGDGVTFTLRLGSYDLRAVGTTKTLEQSIQLSDSMLVTFDFNEEESWIPGIDIPGVPGFDMLVLIGALGVVFHIIYKRKKR